MRTSDPATCSSKGHPALVRECQGCTGWIHCLRTFNKENAPFGLAPVPRHVEIKTLIETEHEHLSLEHGKGIYNPAMWARLQELRNSMGMRGRNEWAIEEGFKERAFCQVLECSAERAVILVLGVVPSNMKGFVRHIVNRRIVGTRLTAHPNNRSFDKLRGRLIICLRTARQNWKAKMRRGRRAVTPR